MKSAMDEQKSPLTVYHNAVRICASVLVAICAILALGTPAHAQSQRSIDVRMAIFEGLTITKTNDLDFGDIIGTTAGTVVLAPTLTPTCTATGGLIQLNTCQPAVFAGAGTSGQRVRVRRPVGNTIILTGPGADMSVTNITINGDPSLTLVRSNINWERFLINSGDGTFAFHVGGTLNVNANQAPGVYNGSFEIRLDYQ
jgi:hypothetical protein